VEAPSRARIVDQPAILFAGRHINGRHLQCQPRSYIDPHVA
jgi:hypothetical protein